MTRMHHQKVSYLSVIAVLFAVSPAFAHAGVSPEERYAQPDNQIRAAGLPMTHAGMGPIQLASASGSAMTVHEGGSHAADHQQCSTVATTKNALRDLWLHHAFWVREVVRATVDGNSADAKVSEAQVVANAQAIAASIEPFYGKAAQDVLFKLLAGHYGAVKAYLTASVAKDTAAQQKALEQILANAEEIANFLSKANPNLPKDDLMGLLQAHGGHHLSQIQQFVARDYAGEAQTWADMSQHMYVIADALVDGLSKQFPDKF